MTDSPRVTIGIPFYNAEKTLADAVRSVFAQTIDDWELLLVDDGSTDSSLDIARSIVDPRVRIVSDGKNLGLPARLNQIADMARAEYVARMDADDLMHPERLRLQIERFETDRHIDLVCSATYTIDDATKPRGKRSLEELDTCSGAIIKQGLAVHPTVTGRAAWFRTNPYDDAYIRAEDRELWCRTYIDSTFSKLRIPLYFYRENHVVNIRNYLKSCQTDRLIFKKYGPRMIGRSATMMLIAKSYAKGELYRLFTTLGLQHILVDKRNILLTDEEYENALEAIERVLATKVPGFDPAERRGRDSIG